jgi:hypothetical protein
MKKKIPIAPIGTIWCDNRRDGIEFYEMQKNQWKFIGYGKKDRLHTLGPIRKINKPHKKDIPISD